MIHIQCYEKFYQPTESIKSKIDYIVNNLLKEHGGGRSFFDALDEKIKDISSNIDIIKDLMRGKSNSDIITSGEFGDILYKLWKEKKIKCRSVLVVNGKLLTDNKPVHEWYPKEFDIRNKDFIFIDDSFFSGTTFRKIENFLKEYDSTIKYTQVVYDGSKIRNKKVKSFFRYYN